MIRTITRLHFLFICITLNLCCFSQKLTEKKQPQGYFQWPLALKPSLSGNFGELRPNHFHMGLDCKTDKKQNQSVLAAADGYVAKIKIEPFGFGRCIYINHPNGLTTVYAHLNEFMPELEKYVLAEQYLQKSWKIFIDIPPSLFQVKKGQFIAFSGNTGGSQGAHLHFEIRNTLTDKVLNPLRFGFPIYDTVAPVIFRLAVYDRTISTYEQVPQTYLLKKNNGIYTTIPPLILVKSDKMSFAISAADRYNGSTNLNGIFEAILYDRGNAVISFQLDNISYDETRYLNAHIDYKTRKNGGPFLQHLSNLPGYKNSIYEKINGDGIIQLDDDSTHEMKIEVKDPEGNMALLQFEIKKEVQTVVKIPAENKTNYQQNEFLPGFINVFENSKISCVLPEDMLYDSIRFQYKELSPAGEFSVYQLHTPAVPLHGYFTVKIKATIPTSLYSKVVMMRSWNDKKDFSRAIVNEGWLKTFGNESWFKSSFREFGNFQLLIDTIPPSISAIGFKEGMNCSKLKHISFVVADNTKEIKNFNAVLDGKWLCFSNDKGRVFTYTFDEQCTIGQHELRIVATDQAGNIAEKLFHFTR